MDNITQTLSGGVHATQENLQQYYADGEAYVRAHPTKSALAAMGTGFLLAQLPMRWMFIAIIKLVFLLVKPATFIYAVAKLMDDLSDDEETNRP